MSKVTLATAFFFLALGASTVALTLPEPSTADHDNPTMEQRRYCDRVDQWRREEMLDVDERVRLGEPDTKGVYAQWCAQR